MQYSIRLAYRKRDGHMRVLIPENNAYYVPDEIRDAINEAAELAPHGHTRSGVPVYATAVGNFGVISGDDVHVLIASSCPTCGRWVLDGDGTVHLGRTICYTCSTEIMDLTHERMTGERMLLLRGREPANDHDEEPTSTRKSIKATLRRQVHERDSYACRYCGARQRLVVDHVSPVCQGGSNDIANLVTACEPCNIRKGGRTPSEASMTLHAPDRFA